MEQFIVVLVSLLFGFLFGSWITIKWCISQVDQVLANILGEEE